MIALHHGRVSIALHPLQARPGPALLCLHAVGGSAEDFRDLAPHWRGPVFALDFSGHGRSERVRSGAYHPELLAGDADIALARIGPARLLGTGIGAYVALLLAGARADLVAAALLRPGAGLDGGGTEPDFDADSHARWLDFAPAPPGCDPAVRRLERDIRPVAYARAFADAARRLLLSDDGSPRPPWWHATLESKTAEPAPADLSRALPLLAEAESD